MNIEHNETSSNQMLFAYTLEVVYIYMTALYEELGKSAKK